MTAKVEQMATSTKAPPENERKKKQRINKYVYVYVYIMAVTYRVGKKSGTQPMFTIT